MIHFESDNKRVKASRMYFWKNFSSSVHTRKSHLTVRCLLKAKVYSICRLLRVKLVTLAALSLSGKSDTAKSKLFYLSLIVPSLVFWNVPLFVMLLNHNRLNCEAIQKVCARTFAMTHATDSYVLCGCLKHSRQRGIEGSLDQDPWVMLDGRRVYLPERKR